MANRNPSGSARISPSASAPRSAGELAATRRAMLRLTLFGRLLKNFRRSVLGCIDSYDSESRRIFQHFSRSTRFAILCTALNPGNLQNLVNFSRFFHEFLQKLHLFCQIRRFSNRFSLNFLRISINFQRSLEIHRNCKF